MADQSQVIHPTNDEALSILINTPGALGELVSQYPGMDAEDLTWLDNWFKARIEKYYTGTIADADKVVEPTMPEIAQNPDTILTTRLELVLIRYFRGFRVMAEPIQMNGDLIVIDGPNTSGKTSLAEALEWLFTGRLSRREDMEIGSSQELENCISSEFCPPDEKTEVSATFVTLGDEPETYILTRELDEDYGATKAAKCTSHLSLNGERLSDQEEKEILEKLFGSVPPILMQHTLRHFVESPPKERRRYFERLLHLDQLTELITKSVVTDTRLDEFPSTIESTGLKMWLLLGRSLISEQGKKLYESKIKLEDNIEKIVPDRLRGIALAEFENIVDESMTIEKMAASLQAEQAKFRQSAFPQLAGLKPKRQIDEQYTYDFSSKLPEKIDDLRAKWKQYDDAKAKASAIGGKRVSIAQAVQLLIQNGVIEPEKEKQFCPVCDYRDTESLTTQRIEKIKKWIPMHEEMNKAQREMENSISILISLLKETIRLYDDCLPLLPAENMLENTIKDEEQNLLRSVKELRATRTSLDSKMLPLVTQGRRIVSDGISITNSDECEKMVRECEEIINGLEYIVIAGKTYRKGYQVIEAIVGVEASQNPGYRLRSMWLSCHENIGSVISDMKWERAKHRAQNDLANIRELLIKFRDNYLEARRISFSSGIDTVWGKLRADRYSAYKKLNIPTPRGRGFPIEIEVKATLDDSTKQIEVDALNVFSESQVNALGIAAFVTRSKLIGHKMLIFDDPVQSMDEEHFKTFAEDVLNHVLEDGSQVIVLTHNDMFARDVSYAHYDRTGYCTMSIKHSRRNGCYLEEGNRKVAERLKLAEKKIDEDDFPEAWRYIRLSIERLYTIAYIKYGPTSFSPEKWKDQAAEYMWKEGAGDVIEQKVPGIGKRLKQILEMSAAGAHDKSSRGETDLRNAIKDLRGLLNNLSVGG